MHQFLNWRWFKKLGGGPVSDLGAHQIDIFNWFLDAKPTSVQASGGVDYYDSYEWHDNVMCIYEYDTPNGVARASYQVLTTTSAGGGFFEYFMGDEGCMKISEIPRLTKIYREAHAPEWDGWTSEKFQAKRCCVQSQRRGQGRCARVSSPSRVPITSRSQEEDPPTSPRELL